MSENSSDHQDVFYFADADADNTGTDTGSVDHLTAADVQTYVVCFSVMVMIDKYNVADLHTVTAYLSSAGALHVGSVRKFYSIISSVAVHGKTGTVKT